MSGGGQVLTVLLYACAVAYGCWLLPSAWRAKQQAKADMQRAREAVAGGTLVIPESYRRQFDQMARASAETDEPGWPAFCALTADRLRHLTGLPDAALALVLADILRMARDVGATSRMAGRDPFDALCGMLLGAATDLSSLERDLAGH